MAATIAEHVMEGLVYFDHLRNQMPEAALLEQSHDALRKSIQNCRLCPHAKLTKPLPLNNFGAPIMVIGETPDDVLFDRENGKLLGNILREAQVDLSQVYLTSLTKCSESSDHVRCGQYLTGEIMTLRPAIVVCLGYKASCAVMQEPKFGEYTLILPRTTYALATYSFADAKEGEERMVLDTIRGQFHYIQSVLQGMRTA